MIFISLLRGVNVSGQKKVPMQQLKELYEELGFTRVQTYIQSGNVIFSSDEKNTAKLRERIEKAIKVKFGFDVLVFVRKRGDFEKIVKNNPFTKQESQFLYVTILSQAPVEIPADLDKFKAPNDKYKIINDVIYFYCPAGYGKTKLSNNLFEKKLNVNATTRNWNTINKLLELTK